MMTKDEAMRAAVHAAAAATAALVGGPVPDERALGRRIMQYINEARVSRGLPAIPFRDAWLRRDGRLEVQVEGVIGYVTVSVEVGEPSDGKATP